MKTVRLSVNVLALLAAGTLAGCSGTAAKSPEVSDSIRKSLDQAGLKDVSVSQDRDKGIVTLGGQVASENDKAQAESLAKSLAGTQVVADQIAVIPVGIEKEAREVNSQYKRERAEKVATRVLNVKQVVNDLQVKNQKASSSY
jgi:osmotically-inducible protein OsmY